MPQARNGKIALDPEAIVRLADGSYFVSDEYGPYIYRFSAEGKMLSAIRPPEAFIPMRKGVQHLAPTIRGRARPSRCRRTRRLAGRTTRASRAWR